jgi:hypothetical protein
MTARVTVRRVAALLVVTLAAVVLVLTLGASSAGAATHAVPAVVAQVSPYQPPPFTGGNGPTGVSLFSVFGRLPLWAQAALVSAATTVAFFVLAAIVRWAWRLVSDLTSRAT